MIRQRNLSHPLMTSQQHSPGAGMMTSPTGGGGLYPNTTAASWAGNTQQPIIKQEIQIREVSSLTSSPDSSPSPGQTGNTRLFTVKVQIIRGFSKRIKI